MPGAAVKWMMRIAMVVDAVALRRPNYFQVAVDFGMMLDAHMGFPEQKANKAVLTTALSEFVVIGENCGRLNLKCPKYCEKGDFKALYCHIHCQTRTETELHCLPDEQRYYPQHSKAAKKLDGVWRRKLPNTVEMLGENRMDQITLKRYSRWSTYWFRLRIQFVSATLFDRRVLMNGSAVFGLRPGLNSSATQLLTQMRMRQILSLAFVLPFEGLKMRRSGQRRDSYITFGAEDRLRCAGWEWRPSTVSDQWILRAAMIDFMGVRFANVTLIFDLTEFWIRIPHHSAGRLISHNLIALERINNANLAIFRFLNCPLRSTVRFLDADNRQFLELRGDSLVLNAEPYKTRCTAWPIVDYTDTYVYPVVEGEEVWRLGRALVMEYCLGFDYAKKSVGFGRRRPNTAHPFLN